MNQLVGYLCHQKLIYEFSPTFVPKPRKLRKIKQNINQHFSHLKSRLPYPPSCNIQRKYSTFKQLRYMHTQFQFDYANPDFMDRYRGDDYTILL